MIGKHLKRNIVLINIILILISGCLGNNSSTMIKTKEKSMYDNNMSKKNSNSIIYSSYRHYYGLLAITKCIYEYTQSN